jgi:hypothetical protein
METEMFFMEDVVMSRKNLSRHDDVLHPDDLRKCQLVFDEIKRQFALEAVTDEMDRVAAITIELYQQGVRDVGQLKQLVGAARGLDVPVRRSGNKH